MLAIRVEKKASHNPNYKVAHCLINFNFFIVWLDEISFNFYK